MAYKITFKKSVAKDLKKISKQEAERIFKKLTTELSNKAGQFPELKGKYAGLRKFRVGNYRVLYVIAGESVLIVGIYHRKDAYKD